MASRKKPGAPRRRKPGTGTIRYKAGRDRPWEAAFPLGHGQYRYDCFATRSEAEAHLGKLTDERDSTEAPRNIIGGSQLVHVFLTQWLETKRAHLKETSYTNYCYYCELAISEGQLGRYRLDEVSRERAAALLAYFDSRNFKNLAQLRGTLRQAFEYALDEGYIRRNPFAKAKAPAVERRVAVVLSKDQRNTLLRVAADGPFTALWHLYSRVGLRRGEGLGLRWQDIDWASGTITIAQQIIDISGKISRSTPKTKRSRRTIPIPPNILDILKAHQERQQTLRAITPAWHDQDLIFPAADGTPYKPRQLLRDFDALLQKAGLPPMHIHDLRHTAEYLLEQDGAPLSVRMALLGHTTAAMAHHYADHADADMPAMRRAIGA